ncbi:hypothetical protein [Streptomyces sp. NPDC001635]
MRELRDAYALGTAVGYAEEASLTAHRRTAMAEMRRLMREDLGFGPLGIQ